MLTKDESVGEPLPGSPQHACDERDRLARLLIWAIAFLVLLFSILKVVMLGYLPIDDALRYAARAVAGKSWDQILVLRPDAPLDHNPGWNLLLGGVHRVANWNQDELVTGSVVSLFCLFCVSPLFLFRRPEAWITSLAISCLTLGFADRITIGRPFLITMAFSVFVLVLWGRTEAKNWRLWGITTLGFAATSYFHGSWYQSVLLVGAFLLSGRVARSIELGSCWLAGSLAGAVFTGDPVRYLADGVSIAFSSATTAPVARLNVIELQPSGGVFIAVIIVILILVVRSMLGLKPTDVLRDPAFILAVIGWLLGMKILRFWVDWGMVGFLVWMTFRLEEIFDAILSGSIKRRLAACCFLYMTFFLTLTGDTGGRWSSALTWEFVEEKNPELAEWIPQPGGIVYTADMILFYRTFFKNPHAPWRYILGFECTFMPKEDLEVYRKILWNFGTHKAYAPWVAKMRPEDRLFIRANSGAQPRISELEWYYAATDTWIGRLPRGATSAGPAATPALAPATK